MTKKKKNKLLFIGSLVFAGIALIFVLWFILSDRPSNWKLVLAFVFLILGYACIILRVRNHRKGQ